MKQVEGQRREASAAPGERLVGRVRERYGYAKDKAEKEVDDTIGRL